MEQSLVAQDTSETEPSSGSENLENDETQESDSDSSIEDSNKCPIELTTEQYPQVQCAKLYNITGKVRYTKNQDGTTGLEDISKLSTYKRNGWFGKPEALLNALSNGLETNEADNKLLFNTLDMVLMRENAKLVFRKGEEINRSDDVRNVEFENKITLDLGEIVVGNAGMERTSPIVATNISKQSRLASNSQEEAVEQSFLQKLWHGTKNRLNQLRTALLPDGFIAQPVLANEVDTSFLNTPTLRVETSEAKIDSNGAVYVVKRDAARKRTQVFSLTEQPIRVTDENDKKEVILSRNQTVVVNQNGILENPFEFRLCGFYRDNEKLLEGLAPRDVDVVRQQPRDMQFAYHAARSLTVPLYHRNCQRQCPPPQGS
ncbi:MAG: hypothetical protein F6J95_031345 [Leptolyngbya sp. SIO1E4]|nr:hypothetical protein [Leptolyngbya sp. SIO1E4]